MLNFAAFALFVVLALAPTEWSVVIWRQNPDVLCMRETGKTTMTCVTWAANGTKTTETALTAEKVAEKWGL